MKRRLLALVMALLMVFGITAQASQLEFNASDVLNRNARSFIEVEKLEEHGLKVTEKNGVYTAKDDNVALEFKKDSNAFKVNGTTFIMDTKTITKEDTLYVPLRIVFETLNYKVGWNKDSKQITIEKQEEENLPVKVGEYSITKTHDKIVSLAPSVTEILFALGAGDTVLGRSQYCNYPKEALEIEEVGSMTEPSVEKIVEKKPTAVIAATHYKPEVLEKLKKANIEVIAIDTPNLMDETYESIKNLGKITGKKYESRALISTMKAKISTVHRQTKKVEKPSAYIVVGTGEYGEYTHGKNSFMNDILEVSGYKNAPQDAEGFKYTLEKLIKLDPYYVLSPAFALEDINTKEAYKGLTAVREGRVVEIDADVFSRPSPRVVDEGIKALLKIAHPEILKSLEF